MIVEKESPRVVVITGGSKGIGRAVACRFAGEGARIVLAHYDPDDSAAEETLKLLADMGAEAESHRLDVSRFQEVDLFFRKILDKFQRVDVLVNNAGITRDTLLMRMNEEDWDMVLNVNLKGVFNCTRAVIRSMIKERAGRIVNISSVVGQIGNPGQANYSASKAGVMALTKTTAKEVAPRGITVNGVAPGFIDTEMTAVLSKRVKDAFLTQIPLGRMGSPEEVAETVYWLCSDAANYITGQIVHVNGGMYM
ncbi:MAG: 3-oxoacyl-[acyl-carrier-protein] reductase [Deltaproteobacteria bacterium]|nr:3-oxoacyl-[acyl-carrier-protein] reductase [Deltaproteobacteria bacterium]MBW2049783.1 3-oxoacyl-[acyl-carrier-protein] reductase [Deltaproteobacteria bacterium]MBW2110580.1 3-oxoacyl-[acyl-carrier-protein] reductase [Deltaproteobacteria bacterium]MBW2352127.1 3-oxoacyl-[acyl-carrier-protein] reductase [Deltaproteobacteria bacterium]HDZ91446.1 3-oxoacyl-[acyl-carrier-protein] reductase [Deltaproteobacteria bacterium]